MLACMSSPGWHPETAQPHVSSVFAPSLAENVEEVPVARVPLDSLPTVSRAGRAPAAWLFAVLGVAMLVVFWFVTATRGLQASLLGALLAFVPLLIVLWMIRLIDKWEPEPRSMLALALAWGAIGSTGLALLFGYAIELAIPSGSDSVAFMTGIQAPIVEEITKAMGLVLIMLFGRRAFDGPVDGIVYGMLIGAGFAFTENILYFARELLVGNQVSVGVVFFMRGVLSPFAHAMYTGLAGLLLGIAVRDGRKPARMFGMLALGVAIGIVLHAIWNNAALLITDIPQWLLFYVVFEVPLFIVCIVVVAKFRKAERELTAHRLREFGRAGWFTPSEVKMVSDPATRAGAIRWSRTLPPKRGQALRQFIKDATTLAMTRQRLLSGRDPEARAEQQLLLQRTVQARLETLGIE